MTTTAPAYLQPYAAAAQRHGAGFGSLLWASPATQAARFDAIARLFACKGRIVADIGCGRADFLDFLIIRGQTPAHYAGIEAIADLAAAAAAKKRRNAVIVQDDFVASPARMFVGADVVVFSGSLNTLSDEQLRSTLRRAADAATEAVVFNFLSGPALAGASWLRWRPRAEMEALALSLAPRVSGLEDYLEGDCTLCLHKKPI